MAGSIYGEFSDQDSNVLSGIIKTANNNQQSLNAALAESDHLRAELVSLQPVGLTITPGERVPNVVQAVQSTIGAALGDIGQAGTASQEPGGGGIPCPEMNEFCYVRSEIGSIILTQVKYVEVDMYLWSPRTRWFERVCRADVVEDQDLWALQAAHTGSRIRAIGSQYHPVIQSKTDEKGVALAKCLEASPCVLVVADLHEIESVLEVKDLHRKGTVKHLETVGPSHIYAAGTDTETLIEFHNLKPLGGEEP